MKIFREFIKNYKATFLLKRRYYKITSVVGLLSVAAGVAIMVTLAFYIGPMLGVDLKAKIGSNSIEKFAVFVAVMSFFIVCLYLGILIVAGSFTSPVNQTIASANQNSDKATERSHWR